MQIAILGTRGIPNHYGGFERFAEVVSEHFARVGHTVYVLSPSSSGSVEQSKGGVTLVGIKTPRGLPRNLQTLLYDYLSLRWAKRSNADIVLECGYSFACWIPIFPKKFRNRVVTNPDGVEFKRKKWGLWARLFLMACEQLSVKHSRLTVCDSPVLADYFRRKYGFRPPVIPYGAYPFEGTPRRSILDEYGVTPGYYLVVSRFTPENSLEAILRCFSKREERLLLVGNFRNRFGLKCYQKYGKCPNVTFLGGIYSQEHLNALRFYSKAYIHGHSVGGTNPSLLEAMACKCLVIAQGNAYNRFVLENQGLYFSNAQELEHCIAKVNGMATSDAEMIKTAAFERVSRSFAWNSVAQEYIKIFNQIKHSS